MVGYGWVAVAIVLTVLVQLAVYRYFGRREGSLGARPVDVPRSAESADGRSDGDGRETLCPSCGARNEPAYTFCRRCASRIGA